MLYGRCDVERTNQPLTNEAARKLMALDVQDKEILTYEKLDEWYTAWGGQCYVSFSGGKDSTVLAYLAARYLSSFRTPPWELNLVFVNTGLEYPEIQKFVNEYADWLRREFSRVTVNLVRLGPKMNIRQVVTKYGYSIVSKDVANCVWLARRSGNGTRMARLRGELLDKDGTPSAYNCENWAFLLDEPFLVSSECCRIMKKNTAHKYDVETKEKPIVATMADEGRRRFLTWTATGCNAFDGKRPMGKPMSFWTEQDVLRFIVERGLPYASVYGDIVASDGENVIANLKADADALRNKLADTEAALWRANAELGAAEGALREMNDKIVRCEAYSRTLRRDVNKMQLEKIGAIMRADYAEAHPWRNLWAWVKRKLVRHE